MVSAFDNWETELYHHGIKGQKWGIRRYQNPDGSLTAEGKARYFNESGQLSRSGRREYKRQYKKLMGLSEKADLKKQVENDNKYTRRSIRSTKVMTGLALAGTLAVPYGSLKSQATLGEYAKMSRDKLALSAYYKDLNRLSDARNNKTLSHLISRWGREDAEMVKSHSLKVAGVLYAGAAVAAGAAFYNGHKARTARYLTTVEGHKKAVEEAKAYSDKFQKAFGDVPVDGINKKR